MTKHERFLKSLLEIKENCIKNTDDYTCCALKCPFLIEENEYGFRDCEIINFVQGETPAEWGDDNI